MLFLKYCSFFLLCISSFSCNWKTEYKKEVEVVPINNDTTKLLKVIKSFEPKRFKNKVPKAFYENRGNYDWWRFPLVYPYSIGCIDITDYGTIYNDIDKTDYDEGGSVQPLTEYFDKFTFNKNYLIASKCKSPFANDTINVVDKYFVFSFLNGKIKSINGLDNLKKELKEIKFNRDSIFMSIKDYENRL